MNSSDRLIQYLDIKNISKNKFYKSIGLSVGYLTKRPEMSSKVLKNIISKYKDLNLHWIVTGEGKMLNNDIIYEDIKNTIHEIHQKDVNLLLEVIKEKNKVIEEKNITISQQDDIIGKLSEWFDKNKAK